VVSIGTPLPGLAAAVVDDDLREAEVGELCIRGPQTALGYWRDPEKTDERFTALPGFCGDENRWYRTGDVVARADDGNLSFRGRKDEQVKIRGYRVELLEIEQVLKAAAQTDLVAVVAWPRTEAGAAGTVAFVVGSTLDEEELLRRAKAQLADYMVPQRVIALPELPRNSNGKIDKKQLLHRLESEHA
jgi:acyl-coenzyme A synthetase/AMP-(fatty) acid ligase